MPSEPTSAATSHGWTFADLTDDELRIYAAQECECRTRELAGVTYTCPAHRAQAEIERRVTA